MNTSNTVASILKGYAWLNAFAGVIASFYMMQERIDGIFVFFVFVAILISSFVIYAVGEVVQILHEIRENTAEKKTPFISDELPDL